MTKSYLIPVYDHSAYDNYYENIAINSPYKRLQHIIYFSENPYHKTCVDIIANAFG